MTRIREEEELVYKPQFYVTQWLYVTLICSFFHYIFLMIHSQALKHDADIPDNLGAGRAVGGGSQ